MKLSVKLIANKPAERRREAGEAAEHRAVRGIVNVIKCAHLYELLARRLRNHMFLVTRFKRW